MLLEMRFDVFLLIISRIPRFVPDCVQRFFSLLTIRNRAETNGSEQRPVAIRPITVLCLYSDFISIPTRSCCLEILSVSRVVHFAPIALGTRRVSSKTREWLRERFDRIWVLPNGPPSETRSGFDFTITFCSAIFYGITSGRSSEITNERKLNLNRN